MNKMASYDSLEVDQIVQFQVHQNVISKAS